MNKTKSSVCVKIAMTCRSSKNTKAIKEYISNQLKHDKETDQLSLFDPRDPFMGSK